MVNEQFQTLRPKLFGIAYRMLGTASDAEDVLQDAYLRLLATDSDKIRSFEAFASTVVTRLALDKLKSAKMQREVYPGIWLPEPVPTPTSDATNDPTDPSARLLKLESLSLAFLLILETLTPEERAVFLLREVFDYGYDEIAQVIDKSEAACRQLLSRAKKSIATHRLRFQPTPEEHQHIFAAFVQASNEGNIEKLAEILTADVTVYSDGGGKATAALRPVQGRESVLKFLQGVVRTGLKPGDQIVVATLNGGESLLVRNREGKVTTAMLFEIAESAIQAIYIMRNPEKLAML